MSLTALARTLYQVSKETILRLSKVQKPVLDAAKGGNGHVMTRVGVFQEEVSAMAWLSVRTKVMSWLATVTTVEKASFICALRMELTFVSMKRIPRYVMEKKIAVMEVTRTLNFVGSAKSLLPTARVS